MSGTVTGGRAAAQTNKRKHGDDFYKKIGAKGGRNGHQTGFHGREAEARKAGSDGGKRSKKGYKFLCIKRSRLGVKYAYYLHKSTNTEVRFKI